MGKIFSRILHSEQAGLLLALVLLCLVISLLTPVFFTAINIKNVLRDASLVASEPPDASKSHQVSPRDPRPPQASAPLILGGVPSTMNGARTQRGLVLTPTALCVPGRASL